MQSLTGQSAGQFIRNYRLNLARELLLRNRVNRTMNISEIAYEVGFNDPKYFTRCFTKHFNVTPSSLLEGSSSDIWGIERSVFSVIGENSRNALKIKWFSCA